MARTHKNLIAWVGGKRLLRATIEKFVPQDIKSYCEPFGGAGWVLFYKDQWADLEIYNDLDSRLVNLFKITKYHPEELKREIQYLLASREMFSDYLSYIPQTDIQKAAQFLFLINFSFGATGKNFATSKKAGRSVKSSLNLLDKIDCINKRLDKVLIENKDFESILNDYDFTTTFFYCDPPYTTGAGYQTTSTKDFDHNKLKECLDNVKGKFLLSYDDSEKIRKLYKDYNIFELERQKGINNRTVKNNRYKELLICNYDVDIADYKMAG